MGIVNAAAGGGTLGAVVGGTLGSSVGLTIGDGDGVGAIVGTTLVSVSGVGTSVWGSSEWWGRNSLVGTKGGS